MSHSYSVKDCSAFFCNSSRGPYNDDFLASGTDARTAGISRLTGAYIPCPLVPSRVWRLPLSWQRCHTSTIRSLHHALSPPHLAPGSCRFFQSIPFDLILLPAFVFTPCNRFLSCGSASRFHHLHRDRACLWSSGALHTSNLIRAPPAYFQPCYFIRHQQGSTYWRAGPSPPSCPHPLPVVWTLNADRYAPVVNPILHRSGGFISHIDGFVVVEFTACLTRCFLPIL